MFDVQVNTKGFSFQVRSSFEVINTMGRNRDRQGIVMALRRIQFSMTKIDTHSDENSGH